LKINPVSSKTQTKSLGFWRDLSRLCATTSSLNQRTPSLFLRQGTTKIMNYSLFTKLFEKVFFLSSHSFSGAITQVRSVKSAFQGTCFSSKAGAKILIVYYKTNYATLFLNYFFSVPEKNGKKSSGPDAYIIYRYNWAIQNHPHNRHLNRPPGNISSGHAPTPDITENLLHPSLRKEKYQAFNPPLPGKPFPLQVD